MKMRDAIEKSIRSYYNGNLPEKAIEASEVEEFKYTLDYFDDIEVAEEKDADDEKDA